jgi:hypothetical protein
LRRYVAMMGNRGVRMDDDFFISIPVNEEKNICISQMTGNMAQEAGAPANLSSGGFFIYESCANAPASGIIVLAKVVSLEAAIMLAELIVGASARSGTNRIVVSGRNDVVRDALLRVSYYSRTLPISAEIDAWLVVHRQPDQPINLFAVRLAAVILAPGCLLREADQVRAG